MAKTPPPAPSAKQMMLLATMTGVFASARPMVFLPL
jgi:hypothetical protein